MINKIYRFSHLAIFAIALVLFVFHSNTPAANCLVNLATDTNMGSGDAGDLRYCIGRTNASPGADVITFQITGSILLISRLPAITDSLAIRGENHHIVIDGQNGAGVVPFTVIAGGTVLVTLSDLTITRGKGNNPDSGGIEVQGGVTLELTNVIIDNCTTLAENGGGIESLSSNIRITNSKVINNHMSAPGSAGAGISIQGGTFVMTGTTVSGNTLPNPSDIGGAGIHLFGVSLARIENSSISGNINGNYGAGIHNNMSSLRMSNVTVSGNTGGQQAGGVSNVGGTLLLRNCTISGNSVTRYGGGIYNVGNGASMTLANTIVSGNMATIAGQDIYNFAALNRAGVSIVQAAIVNSGTITGPGTILNVNPALQVLRWNGGLVDTQGLGLTSPARNAGVNAEALDTLGAPLLFDARGPGFGRVRGAAIDIGAFESSPTRVGFGTDPDR